MGDIEAMAAVDAVADTLGVAVTPPGPGSHYEAEICFGSASYKAIAVLTDYRERRRAIERLGEAALEAEDDARNEREYEAHEADEAWLDAHPDEFVNDEDEDESGHEPVVQQDSIWSDPAVRRAVRETIAESEVGR